MKQLRSPRRLIKMWRRRKKAAAEHVVDTIGNGAGAAGIRHSAFTATGLAIEEQIRKARGSSAEGLAIFIIAPASPRPAAKVGDRHAAPHH